MVLKAPEIFGALFSRYAWTYILSSYLSTHWATSLFDLDFRWDFRWT